MAINKVIFNGNTLIDLTADTVTADKVLTGYKAHAASGEVITGTCAYDVNSGDATVKVAEILYGKTAYANGSKLTGTMPNQGSITLTISDTNEVSIPQGYHDGGGKVQILSTELAKIIAGNIKQGITILGVEGTLEPSSEMKIQASKSVTPTASAQTVTPDDGYDYLAQVNVGEIPYEETTNASGITVTIG